MEKQAQIDFSHASSELISDKPDLIESDLKFSEKNSLKVRFSKLENFYPHVLVVYCYGKILNSNCLLFHRIFDICIKNLQYFIIFEMNNVISVDYSVWDFFISKISKILRLNGIVLFSGIKKELFLNNDFAKTNICNCASLDICLKVFHHLIIESEKSTSSDNNCPDIITLLNNLRSPEMFAYIDSSPIQNSSIENTNVFPLIAAIERKSPGKLNSNNFDQNTQDKLILDSKTCTLPEKIHLIISQHGPCSFSRIKNFLQSEEFGSEKISTIGLYFLLKSLNLETLAKRVRYYRSC